MLALDAYRPLCLLCFIPSAASVPLKLAGSLKQAVAALSARNRLPKEKDAVCQRPVLCVVQNPTTICCMLCFPACLTAWHLVALPPLVWEGRYFTHRWSEGLGTGACFPFLTCSPVQCPFKARIAWLCFSKLLQSLCL